MSQEAPTWLQGHVIASSSALVEHEEFLRDAPFWLVVTHSCSIYNPNCQLLELMPFHPLEYSAGQHNHLRRGQNPREFFLVTEKTIDAKPKPIRGYSFNQTKRSWIDKQLVLSVMPAEACGGVNFDDEQIQAIIAWLSGSYTRAALPAAFEAAAKPIFDQLKAFLRGPYQDIIGRVYLDIEPRTVELAPPAKYLLEVILIPEEGTSEEELRAVVPTGLCAVNDLGNDLLSYAGISVMDLESLRVVDAERWVWWDHMDYLSSQDV